MGPDDAEYGGEDRVGIDCHVGGDVVEQGGPEEDPAFQAGLAERQIVAGALAAVHDEVGASGHTVIDVVANSVKGGPGDQRPVVCLGVQAVPDPQIVDPLN